MSHSVDFAKQTGLFLFLNKRKQVMSKCFLHMFLDLKNKQKSAKIIKDNVYHTNLSYFLK